MNKEPRILFYDIEATNLSASMGYILCIGYKFLGDKKVTVMSLEQYPGKKSTDDSELIKAFKKIHDGAEMVCFHFGEFYDQPFINTRLLMHKMKPLAKVALVDTWRIAKKRLKFHSNRLDAIAKALDCPYSKTSLDGRAWIDASAGDKRALKYVVHHCKQDVLVLEWCYNRLKVIWDQHPALYGKARCNSCGSKELKSEGIRATIKKVYRRLICKKCGLTTKGDVIK